MGKVSMPQGKGSQLHNRREYSKIDKSLPDNIDASKTAENVTLIDKDIRQAYAEIFGEALKRYNAKQKRNDRKIEDYYDHILKSKNGEKPFYEDVVQWGTKEDFQSEETRQTAKKALIEYVNTFEGRNPNLRLIGAYIHMDEASPHLHLDYIPVAHGYRQGMEIRNSLDKAMKQMGFLPENESRKNNATKLWKESERAVFGNICRSLGLEIEAEQKSTRRSLSVEEYKEAKEKMLGEIAREKATLTAEVQSLKDLTTDIAEIDNTSGKKIVRGLVAVKLAELDLLKKQAKAYTANRDEIVNIRTRSNAVDLKEKVVELRENDLIKWQADLHQMYHRQTSLNKLLELAEIERDEYKQENASLKAENSVLRAELEKVRVTLTEQVNALKTALKQVCRGLTNIVKAIGMLKYSEDKYGIDELTEDQENLIDGITNYGVGLAENIGFDDMAEDMSDNIGISQGIEEEIHQIQENREDEWELEW